MAGFFAEYGGILLEATWQSIYMIFVTVFFSYLLGLPLGIWSYVTDKDNICENKPVHAVLDWIINITRSIPFIILMITIIPFTRLVAGTSIGPTAAIVPLVAGAVPFVARVLESSFNEIDKGLISCAKAMGATNMQIITKVLLPETLPSIVRGMSITAITLVGYTAMAGAVGGGGLGDVAIRYGYHRYQYNVMIATIIILIIMVQLIQFVFNLIAKRIDKNI